MKKKVSVITLQSVKNYGSVLQTLATQNVLEKAGFEVSVINYIKPGADDKDIANTWSKNTGKSKLIIRMVLFPTIKRWKKVFTPFLNENIKLTKMVYKSEEDFDDVPVEADAYCVGSDQVWNSSWNHGIVKPFFLNFTKDNDYRFALSSSFGKESLSDTEKKETASLLARFNRISVREERGLAILENLGIKNGVQVVDPTLMETAEFWNDFAGEDRLIEEEYVLLYQLNSDKRFDEYAKKVAQKKGIKLVRLCTRFDQFYKGGKPVVIPTVKNFVNLFKNASFVLTDSFHGTSFSINLQKPFISIYPNDFSSRLSSILKLTQLEDRHLKSFEDFSLVDAELDFANSEAVLTCERSKIKNYLHDVLEDISNER